MNEHCMLDEQLHFFNFLASCDRAPSTLPSDGWSIKLAPLLVSVQGEHFVVGVKFIEITRWAWAGQHTSEGPRDSPQETGDSRRTRQDLWSGRAADTTQAKGIFLLFFCHVWGANWFAPFLQYLKSILGPATTTTTTTKATATGDWLGR